MKLILASNSPQRRELLATAGYRFEIVPPSEGAESGEAGPAGSKEFVLRMAGQKAADVARRVARRTQRTDIPRPNPGDTGRDEREGDKRLPDEAEPIVIVACDTVAECGGEILGKPRDEADARRMLTLLSGREHHVVSGLCLWPMPGGPPRMAVDVTTLKMDALTTRQLDDYLASGQWREKAGAFGYQDQVGWIRIVDGSESNVIGLPMELLASELRALAANLP